MVRLNTPYNEKDIAKRLGAEWNNEGRFWFVPDHLDYRPFRQWIDPNEWERLEAIVELPFSQMFKHIDENLNVPYIRYQVEADVMNEFHLPNAKIIHLIDNHKHSCVLTIFIPQKLNLNIDLREKRVKVVGVLDFYASNGRFQLIAEKVEIVGDCSRINRLNQWEKECQYILEKESSNNEFNLDFSKRLRIGVITSNNSEGFDDFRGRLSQYVLKNEQQLELKLLELSASNMADAIAELNKSDCDCICLIRGGGDKESLLPFSDPILLTAIHQSSIPIIIGVGHRADKLLCKRVKGTYNADTPTGAAEYLNKLSGQHYKEYKKNGSDNKLKQCECREKSLREKVMFLENENFELRQKLSRLTQSEKKGIFKRILKFFSG